MQTQCPHCKSHYNIGAEQVDAYGGFVRCGKCNYKFNIHDQVLLHRYRNKPRSNTEPSFNHNGDGGVDDKQRIEPKIDTEPDDDGVNIRFRELEDDYEENLFEPTIDTDAALELDSDPIFSIIDEGDELDERAVDLTIDADLEQELETGLSENNDELEETLASLLEDEQTALEEVDVRAHRLADQDDSDAQSASKQGEQQDVPQQDGSEQEEKGEDKSDVEPEKPLQPDDEAVPDEKREPEIDPQAEESIDDDQDTLPSMTQIEEAESSAPVFSDQADQVSEEDETEEPMVSLINDEAETPARSGASPLLTALVKTATFLFWTGLSIALAYFLFGQIKDKLYPAYKDMPVVQAMRTSACEYLPCTVAEYDTEAYEIVVSRMDEIRLPKRHLHISIFMMNKSTVEQVYPRILITLKRLDGSIAGQRVIKPAEYFKSYDSFVDVGPENGQTQVIKPNKLGKVLIKLNNPPSDAVGFEAKVVH